MRGSPLDVFGVWTNPIPSYPALLCLRYITFVEYGRPKLHLGQRAHYPEEDTLLRSGSEAISNGDFGNDSEATVAPKGAFLEPI